jgi:hypothetical protein
MFASFTIEFENPNLALEGKERKSKLLKKDSLLYKECKRKQQILKNRFLNEIGDQRMDFHLELIKDNPSKEELVLRAQKLEKNIIDVNKYELTPKSIGIQGPYLENYGYTHITLGYFPNGLPKVNYDELLK